MENLEKTQTLKDKYINASGKFYVEDNKDEIFIQGKPFSSLSTIYKNQEPYATLKRTPTVIIDAFELEADEKDIPFLIALIIAYDNLIDKIRK